MPVQVSVPTILRSYTGGEKSVTASGDSLKAVIDSLEAAYPGIGDRLVDESGLRRFVNVYLNDEDVRFLDGLQTPVADGDAVTILPAVAGGSGSGVFGLPAVAGGSGPGVFGLPAVAGGSGPGVFGLPAVAGG